MNRCGGAGYGVTSVLVGLQRMGLVGLAAALEKADTSGLKEPEELTDLLVEALSERNYVGDEHRAEFRTALWREYLRHQGRDPSDFYSEIDVTVLGAPGEERARFVEGVCAGLAALELKPVVDLAPESGEGPFPKLVIAGQTVVAGIPATPRGYERALRRNFSDW